VRNPFRRKAKPAPAPRYVVVTRRGMYGVKDTATDLVAPLGYGAGAFGIANTTAADCEAGDINFFSKFLFSGFPSSEWLPARGDR